MKYTQEVDWNNTIVTTGDHGEIIEVPFTVQSGLKTKVGEQNYLSYHRLLLKKSADGFTYNHVQILTKNEYFDNTDKSFNFYQITDDFDGIVLVVNQKNEAVQFSSFKNSILLKPSITGKMATTTCIYMGWEYENGDFRAIALVGCFGGGGDSNDNGGYPPHVGGGGGSGGGISAPTPLQIIDELTGKAKCLNALLNKNGDSFVQKLLANFQGKSEFDIKIVSVDKIYAKDANGNFIKDANGNLLQSNGVTTYTREINKSLINIAISTSRANDNSSLDVARTILHEYIHADIIRKLYTENNISGPLDFNLIYQKYGSQHGTMAALYLSSMKEALKEFNKTVLPNDYKNYTDYYGEEPSDAFYEALAWSGLKENNVQAWTNLTAQQQQDINNLAARVTKMSKTVNCPQ
nr:hypothetical protein [uncultured Flavobacterium sp.]